MGKNRKETNTSRREFMKKSSLVVGGFIGGGVLSSIFGPKFWNDSVKTTSTSVKEQPNYNQALMYFTKIEDFNVLKVASERIFPEDENGPGAIALLVPFYIDHQLASLWGQNTKEYMQGPFFEGEPTQGYQTRLKRHQIFDLGIQALQDYSQKKYQKNFIDLEEEEQDEVLKVFEQDKVEIPGISASLFFELLRSITIEGIYADPLYGGNKDMKGWRMKEYPGDQMSYLDVVDSEEFVTIEPMSLRDHHN